ncbi:DUF4064 domain-containing protein [Staphylococcus sp. NRL 16/872]|uniref:DUF4064 domain-containing protein n=1 Tax=Staphylococcus sp. NRL 16/872 TaxID=2930131 RepID=UPI001FB1FFDA|nr:MULTISPECIES: DUF4064 domain-containing protein [unclassified Staphylococcus]MCJ1656619.1 DUF4064 domain-containing protein [Staphylococcus sp. NRL 21/187]MCJ1662370.1 DUF4064 domain-containing protein [Staphylococcus sp. NRL 18/288]MCJ1668458.1 DUF4064 domain-containing protein [Staphylococcus sp. NRL 19/737]WEN68672.1 DUF4064 domain-containing protein [Staphylococcus sp. NRL 16/872]
MNRKVELILAWIASGLSAIYLLINLISFFIIENKAKNTEQYTQIMKQFGNQNGKVTPEMVNFTMTMSIATILFSTILGIVGTIVIKNRPILAGCLLVAASLIGVINMSIISSILWFIVAIMLFVKRNNNQNERGYRNNYSRDEWHPEDDYQSRKKDDPYIY